MKIAEESSQILHGKRITWDKKVDAVLMHPFSAMSSWQRSSWPSSLSSSKSGIRSNRFCSRLHQAEAALASRLGDGLLFYLAEGLIQGSAAG